MAEIKRKYIESELYIEEQQYVRPKDADKKMKAAQTVYQTVYIYGISGCGKTSFIRDFLGRRRYLYFSAKNLKLEDLQIPQSGMKIIVVLDDLHLLTMDERQETLQREIGILAQRKDVWLILSGRSRMPSWLTPFYYKLVFTIIEETDLNLSNTELTEYFDKWNLALAEENFQRIVQLVSGIGIVARIIAVHLSAGSDFNENLIEKMRNDFWNYMDHQVYDQWDLELQEFLMQICIVEEFNIHLAEMITGRNDVERMISIAFQVGNFLIANELTGSNTIYEIKPSMRLSMRRRFERTYTKEKRIRFYHNAGLYYELANDTPNAMKMYEICHDTERIAELLVVNARKNPASGHFYELRQYYLSLPDEKILESIELMSGMSMLQSLLLNVNESERWYEELRNAENRFNGSSRRAAKSWIVYLDIALPHRGSIKMTDIMKNAATLLMNRKINLSEFSVTSNLPSQMNGGKDFCEWSKRDRDIAKSMGKILEFTLGKYGKGLVNLALAESFLEKGGDSYEISNLANKGMLQAQAGGKMEQCFVAVGILSWLYVLNNHVEDAEELLMSFKKKAENERLEKLLPNLTAFQVRIGLYQGNIIQAEEWMKEAPDEQVEFTILERLRYLTKVRIYLFTGRNEKALSLLQRLLYYAQVMKRTYIDMESRLLLAITEYRMNSLQWDECLKEVLSKAESYHFVRLISREGAAVSRMLKETTWKPKDQEYWEAVKAETEKMALAYPSYLKVCSDEAVFGENAVKILRLQAEGLSTAKIAVALDLKVENVKYHNKQNFRKLGVNSKTAAVMEARKRKII